MLRQCGFPKEGKSEPAKGGNAVIQRHWTFFLAGSNEPRVLNAVRELGESPGRTGAPSAELRPAAHLGDREGASSVTVLCRGLKCGTQRLLTG